MKTGNNNSNLLSQLIKAAEEIKPKAKNDFAVDIFKAAKVKTASVEEIITAALIKKGQADPFGSEPIPGQINDSGLGSEDLGSEELGAEESLDTEGGSEEAKTKIAEALVALCGGDVEACCDFIKSCCGGGAGELPVSEEAIPQMEGPPAPAPENPPAPMAAPSAM